MTLIAKEQSDYTPIPEGTHRAVASAVVSIGLQNNPFGKPKPQLLIRYEFSDIRVESEVNGQIPSEPKVRWQYYTVSLHKDANLRRDLESWRDKGFTKEELKGFDVMNILGHACEVTIIHEESGDQVKDKIRTVRKFTGVDDIPRPELEIIRYTDNENEQWDLLPEFIKEKIRNQVKEGAPTPKKESFKDNSIQDIDVPFKREVA
jgi:hypothetical protein